MAAPVVHASIFQTFIFHYQNEKTRLLRLRNGREKSLRRFVCFWSGWTAESNEIFLEDRHPFITKWGHFFLQNSYSKQQNFLRIFKHSWKTTIKKTTFLNVHLLCKKHFIDCYFVLSEVFEKSLENSATFGWAIVREIRHVQNQICWHGQFP